MKTEELISRVASEAKITKGEARKVLTEMVKIIANALSKDETVTLPNFGSFLVKIKRARAEIVGGGIVAEIPPKVPVFQPSKVLIEKFLKERILNSNMEKKKSVISRSEVEEMVDHEIRRGHEIMKECGLNPAPTPYAEEARKEYRKTLFKLLIKDRYVIKE